jgi:glycosyltransferase involved in cell wall biosynthesis
VPLFFGSSNYIMTTELSIVIPCLNEAETIVTCVRKAAEFLVRTNTAGEIIVADNGSTDASTRLAADAGARVVRVQERGYGAAILGGINAAKGEYVIVGDADDSYDFSRLDNFIAVLRDGYDLVIGNRFAGGIAPQAMPLLHKYLGNPVLSWIGRLFFGTKVRDFHCGLRGFRRTAIQQLGLQAPGMEFASEMIVKASLAKLKIAEVPTTLSKDGRVGRKPHLRTWRDGWRHLRFLLMFSPRWLFFYPGIVLLLVGSTIQLLLFHGGVQLGHIGFDIHTMLYAAAMSVIGVQMVWLAVFCKVFGATTGFLPRDNRVEQILSVFTLERGLLVGLALFITGLAISAKAVFGWIGSSYGALDPKETMRMAIPAVTMILTGIEFMLASFFVGILQITRR